MRRLCTLLGLCLALARPASAELLTVTAIEASSGTIVVEYGGLVQVLYDRAGVSAEGCVPFVLGCDAVQFAGGPWGATYTFVRSLMAPIVACTYEVIGTFTMGGTVYEAASPVTFTFTFDEPTMRLPLPTYAAIPPFQPGAPWQSTFVVQQLDVTRADSVPEPSVAWLLLTGLVITRWKRRR